MQFVTHLRPGAPGVVPLLALLLLAAAAILFLPASSALVLVAAAGLGLGLLRYPELAIYLLVFAVPFGSLMPLPLAGANVTAADGLLLVAFALWLARGVARRRIEFRRASLLIPFLVFILAAALSVTGALSLQSSAKELAKWAEMAGIYFLIAQDFGPVQFERMLAVILVAGLAEAGVGVYQYRFNVGPEGFLLFGGSSLRVFGTFEQPNPFAGYLGLIIPLALGIVVGVALDRQALQSRTRAILLALGGLALAAMLAALYLSYSRGAWLGVAAALVVTVMVRSRRAALVVVLGVLVLAGVVLLGQMNLIPDVVSERFSGVSDYLTIQDVRGVTTNDANYALVERLAHWEAAGLMFEAHPWLGVGIGNYAVVYPVYSLPHWDDPLGHAHNYYLNMLAETGIIGEAGYVFLWSAVFWTAWRSVRKSGGWRQGVAAGALGVLVALSVHNLFDNLFVHSMHVQVGMTLGLLEIGGKH